MNQSIELSINHLSFQLIHRLINQSTNRSVDRSISQSLNKQKPILHCTFCTTSNLIFTRGYPHLSMWLRAVFTLVLHYYAYWLAYKNSPPFQPIRNKTKTNRDSLAPIFPHLASATCIWFEFWLVCWIFCARCGWPVVSSYFHYGFRTLNRIGIELLISDFRQCYFFNYVPSVITYWFY